MDLPFDSLATVTHIPSFILLFFLVLLFILNDCVYFGLIIRSMLKSNFPNWNTISPGDTLDCWHFLWDEGRKYNNAVFLHRGSHNLLPHTSLPLGSCWTTQVCLQPDLQRLNVWLFGIYYLCVLTLPTVSTIELLYLCCLSWHLAHLLRKPNPENLDAILLDYSSLPGQRLE